MHRTNVETEVETENVIGKTAHLLAIHLASPLSLELNRPAPAPKLNAIYEVDGTFVVTVRHVSYVFYTFLEQFEGEEQRVLL